MEDNKKHTNKSKVIRIEKFIVENSRENIFIKYSQMNKNHKLEMI